ncbi:hypothetical protein J4467_03370 [Candidatus Woesearchaeota archaeon]|nr:hypothetical protein [Candidatus Woesearchaeota archaeon]
MKKIIAIFVMIMFICLPIASSAEIVKDEDYDEQDSGATIAINARSYEPTILTSNLLEDNSVPVYVYLAGATVGSLIPSSYNVEPVYGGIEIEKMRVKALDAKTNDFIEGSPDFVKPNKVDIDTLGYLVVTLKQFDANSFEICNSNADCDDGFMCETGACYPTEINLSFTAEIWFKEAERLYSLSKSALMLPANSDEDQWITDLESNAAMYSFFGGRGLVRVRDIDDNTVYLTVYSNKDLYWPIIEAPRPIADVVLDKGETSEYIDLGYTDEQVMQNAMFRITLNDLRDPLKERATVAITMDGSRSMNVISEGSSLYPGSIWTVSEILMGQGREGWEYNLKLKDSKGNTKTLTTTINNGMGEGKSEVLARKFSPSTTRIDDGIYYTTSTKSITEETIDQLDTVFQAFEGSPRIDVSEVEGDVAKLNRLTLESGLTVRDVLIAVLPSGYYYSVNDIGEIVIKRYSAANPCDEAEIYTEEYIDTITTDEGFSEEDSASNRVKVDLLCSSIAQFESIIENYDEDVLLVDKGTPIIEEAYLMKALAYEALKEIDLLTAEEKKGATTEAYESYKYLVDHKSNIASNLDSKLESMQNELYGDAVYGTGSLDDNGNNVYVELISVSELTREDEPSATISKNGLDKEYYLDDEIFTVTDGKVTYRWELYKVSDGSVTLRKMSSDNKVKQTKTIKVDEKETLDGSIIKIESVNPKKVAYLTITPGSGGSLRSTSNFSIHIPIERRAIQLNPEKIDDKIEKAKKLQEKIGTLTDKLDKIVRTWNYVCLGVMAFVTVKTGLSGDTSAVRSNVLHGVDGTGGWHDYCVRASSGTYSEREYNTYDDCMQSNAGEIQSDIELALQARDYSEGSFENDAWYQSIVSRYATSGNNGVENLERCQELLGDDAFLDTESMKSYAYYEFLKQNAQAASNSNTEPFLDSVDDMQGGVLSTQDLDIKPEACKAALSSVDNSQDKWKDLTNEEEILHQQKKIAAGAFETEEKTLSTDQEIPVVKGFSALKQEYLTEVTILQVGKVFKSGLTNQKFEVYTSAGYETVTEMNYNDYKNILVKQQGKFSCLATPVNSAYQEACTKINDDLTTLTGDTGISDLDRATYKLVADSGAQFYISSNSKTIYVGLPAYSTGSISEKYASGARLEMFCSGEYQGLPYCLPYKNGNFIKFDLKEGYTKANEIDTISLWNVGPDGQLCTDDDVLVEHESTLHFNTADPNYGTLKTFANKYVKMDLDEPEVIDIGGTKFIVSCSKSKSALGQAEGNCYDVMGINDCKLLFNTCDPVMCPPSRFNLNGRWQVDNVVESGLIGSVVLGLGNGDVMPICLTGVLSSLKYYDSMIDGYVECLEAAKFEGKSVGICDKVRNVYTCEIITREVASILDSGNGGLLDVLASKVFGREEQGGGEYLKIKEAIGRMEDSVSFLTTQYASTAFAAFRGRTLEEVGTTFCKQAIYANTPWFEDFMGQLTTPEDPTQFYASLTAKTYAPSQGETAYGAYYHIYAGTNENIERVVYTVYLKNSLTSERFEVTGECGGASASLDLGGMVDQNINCIGPEGMDQVCVVLNGETHCGFGSVTTAFSSDYLKNSLIAEEARKNIDSEEECFPSATSESSTINSLASLGISQSFTVGELSTGIQRVCSINDPGAGQGGSWTPIGTCGTDSDDRSLGDCWINEDSININDAKKSEVVNEHLEEVAFAKQKEAWGIVDTLDIEKSSAAYVEYLNNYKKSENCKDNINYASHFRNLYMRTISYDYAASSEYYIGMIFYDIALNNVQCGMTGRKEIDYVGYLDGRSIGTLSEYTLKSDDQVTFTISFKNVQDGEEFSVTTTSNNAVIICDDAKDSCSVEIDMTARDGMEYIIVPITIVNSDGEPIYIQEFKFTINAPEDVFEEAGVLCDGCGGLFGLGCEMSTCHSNGDACYFNENGIDECFACEDLTTEKVDGDDRCQELSYDEKLCEDDSCYDLFLEEDSIAGSCYWDDGADDGEKCKYTKSSSTRTTTTTTTVASGICAATGGKDAYENALLDMVAAWESGGDYFVYNTGTSTPGSFTDCSEGHPAVQSYSFPSPQAAGRYQFIKSTYEGLVVDGYFGTDGLDFCQAAQDEAALSLIYDKRKVSYNEIVEAYTQGPDSEAWVNMIDKLAPEWDAFPYSHNSHNGDQISYYGHNTHGTIEDLYKIYDQCFNDVVVSSEQTPGGIYNEVFDEIRVPRKKAAGSDLTGIDAGLIGVAVSSGMSGHEITSELENALIDLVTKANDLGFSGTVTLTSSYRENDNGLHGSGNAVDIRTNDLSLKDRLILIRAAIESGFGEIYNGEESGSVGLSAEENDVLECFWLDEHGNHLHIGLEDSTQSWESCI